MAETTQYFKLATKESKRVFRASELKNIIIEVKADSLKRIYRTK